MLSWDIGSGLIGIALGILAIVLDQAGVKLPRGFLMVLAVGSVLLIVVGLVPLGVRAYQWATEKPLSAYVGAYESHWWSWDGHENDARAIPLAENRLKRRYRRDAYHFVPIIGCWIPGATIAKDSDLYMAFFGSDLTIPPPKEWRPMNPSAPGIREYWGKIDQEIMCGNPPPATKIGKGPDEMFAVAFPKPGEYFVKLRFEGRTVGPVPQSIRYETHFYVVLY